MSEEKKKMYYYYAGKEKKAGELKKREAEMAPYSVQREFDRMMERFQREFDDMWRGSMRMRRWAGFPMNAVW